MTEPEGIEVSVEKLVPGGDGFLHLPDGRAAFVRGAAPGDKLRVRRLEKQRGAWVVVDFDLVAPSPERVAPECPVAAVCGGCDMMQISRAGELGQKERMLREALERIGGVSTPPSALTTAGESAGYRSRVRFHVGKGGKLGFFARGSHQLVEVPRCLVADERINRALSAIRRLARRYPEALGGFTDVELRATEEGVIARFVPRDGIKPIAAEPLLRALGKDMQVVATAREAEQLHERRSVTAGTFIEIPADAFSQINVAVNRELVAAIVSGATSRGLTTFCDLFAGVGNFALPLAHAGLSGMMVERTPSAVAAAQRVAAAQGITQLKTRTADAARALTDLIREGKRYELVVLDPPREGAPEVVAGLAGLTPRAVAYVGCDPVTLSRDLKPLLAAGMRISSVQGFDMFPRTHHFETLVWLEAG
ncbi:MAG: class I SAM-dependent RNA methyltransferase [Myxococcales bacterium]|nr:MAG: class I SAM-dependent RNA methyltransferase [Myxococcales bacterium]